MEKINIAELLKYCPKGMELYCTMIDNVVFEKLDFISFHHPIIIRRTDSNKTIHLTKYGQYSDEEDYKCVIFPKGKTTWEGFVPPCQFKDGDVISDSFGSCIFKREGKIKGTVDYYCGISSDSDYFSVKDNKCRPDGHYGNIVDYRLATEEEKEKLFQAIKENGYNWNPETKTLKKLVQPKFKVGDRIKSKVLKSNINTITKVCENHYELDEGFVLKLDCQDKWELILNKFDISTLVPFESRVLVRAADNQFWRPAIWGVKQKDWDFYCVVGGEMWEQCIPYECNEHLIGKTNDCADFYKTWD